MGRVRDHIEINGKLYLTLFDTGARNTYVVEDVASHLQRFDLEKPEIVKLGGKVHKITQDCRLVCRIKGLPVRVNARVIDNIGIDEKGQEIKVLFGALSMQEWGIELNLKEEKIDMSHYPKEFIEF